MARDPYTEQRLINWGRWKAGQGAGGLGYAATNWDAFDGGDRYGASAPVLPDGDDAITDEAVTSLGKELQEALVVQYVAGGSQEQKAAKLSVHERTFRTRVDTGHRGVSAWLAERARRVQDERDRVESLQRATSMQLAAREREALVERRRTDLILGIKAVRIRKR